MPPKNKKYSDDFQTPGYAIEPLIPFLKKDWIIWECACGKGNLVNAFKKHGFKVIGTDILDGKDFLKWQPEGKRQELFRKYGIELLLLDKRINFETPSGKGSGAWFPVAWFCWKLLPEKIVFGSITK